MARLIFVDCSAGNFYAGDGSAASSSYSFRADQNTGLFRPAGDTIAFSTGSTERVRISDAGNVGIGTTTPLTKLEVQGTASASNLLTIGGLQVAGGASVGYSRFGTGTTSHASDGFTSVTNSVFITGNLVVDSSVWFDSNASVSGNLEVGGVISGFSIANASSVSGNLEVGGVIKASDGTAALPSYTFEADTNTGLFRGGTDILGFTTAGAERMRLDANGNLGIGTTSPVGVLDVRGDLAGSANPLFRVASVSELFRITEAGNVGMVPCPEQKLEVGGNILALQAGDVDLTSVSH